MLELFELGKYDWWSLNLTDSKFSSVCERCNFDFLHHNQAEIIDCNKSDWMCTIFVSWGKVCLTIPFIGSNCYFIEFTLVMGNWGWILWFDLVVFCPIQRIAKKGYPTVSEDQYYNPCKEHYENEIYLTGQNPPSKCCQPFDFWFTFLKGLDLLN